MKTMVIGLGGAGTQAVLRAQSKCKDYGTDPDMQVCFAAIDHNVRRELWERDPQGIKPLDIARSDRTVRELVEGNPDAAEWLPTAPAMLHTACGTFNTRSLARLCFLDSMRCGKLDEWFDGIISSLDGITREDNCRIVIVTSLAGNTGSGIFIQLALYLRKRIRELFGVNCDICGYFIMPEVFYNAFDLMRRDQRIYSCLCENAYASLCEMDLINGIKTGQKEPPETPITLDSLFDSSKEQDGLPLFDRVCFYNGEGGADNNMNAHEDHIAGVLYAKLLSPSAQIASMHDISYGHMQLFGGGSMIVSSMGVCFAKYSAGRVIKYCTLREMQSTVKEKWRYIDRAVDDRIEAKRRIGERVSPSERRRLYVITADELAERRGQGSRRHAFSFADETRELSRKTDVNGESVFVYTDKAESFIDKLKEMADEGILKESGGLFDEPPLCLSEGESDRIRSAAEREIRLLETMKGFASTVSFFLSEALSHKVMGYPDGDGMFKESGLFSLFNCVDENGKISCASPEAAKYILYKLCGRLEETLANELSEQAIDRVDNDCGLYLTRPLPKGVASPDPTLCDTPYPLAVLQVNENRNFFARRHFYPLFCRWLTEYSAIFRKSCREYARMSVQRELFKRVLAQAERLCDLMDENLASVERAVDSALEAETRMTEQDAPHKIPVCSRIEHKEAMYSRMECHAATPSANRQLLLNIRGELENESDNDCYVLFAFDKRGRAEHVCRSLFDDIKSQIAENEAHVWNIDVFTAAAEGGQAEYAGDPNARDRACLSLIQNIVNKAGENTDATCSSIVDHHTHLLYQNAFFGMNPDTVSIRPTPFWTAQTHVIGLPFSSQREWSKNTLCYFIERAASLSFEDLSPVTHRYRPAYLHSVERLGETDAIFYNEYASQPHLDKRWIALFAE